MKKSKLFFGLLSIMLVFAVFAMGCVQDIPNDEEDPDIVNAQAPAIYRHPTSRNYEPGDPIQPLSITAGVTDDGVLSYEWYQSDAANFAGAEKIDDETESTYAPPQDIEGNKFYWAVVTNTNENVDGNKTASTRGNVARITVAEGSTVLPSKSITINADDRQQYIRGFGGMSSVVFRAGTGGSSPDINADELRVLFDKNGQIRLNMFRITLYDDLDGVIGNEYPGGNGVWQDNSDYYDLVKVVNENDGYVFACPWTPPAYYKTNTSLVGGGHVEPTMYGNLAAYFKAFLDRMAANGAPLYAISPQNEPNFSAEYEGCDYSQEQMRDFIKVLGPALANTPGYGGGQPTDRIKIMTGESANHPNISDDALDDPVSAQYIDIIPRHYYGNVQVKYNKALDMGKEVWETEYSDTTGLANNLRVYTSTWSWMWQFLNWVDCSQRLNNESAFVWWYSKRFYGLIGDGEEGGPPPMTITNRGYALGHYARFATNTTRVGITTDGINDINNTTFNAQSAVPKCTAYESMDGNSYSMVIFTPAVRVNGSGEGTGSVDLGTIAVNFPEGFVATSAYALKSNISEKMVEEFVILSPDGKSAVITVPANTILSVQFSR